MNNYEKAVAPAVGSSTSTPPAVRVWLHRVPAVLDHVDRFDDMLAQDEIDKALRLRRPIDRITSLEAAAMLRVVIGSELGVPPRDVVITRACDRCGDPIHGKPRLVGGRETFAFNISHAAGLVVLALAHVEVGVDVEGVGGPELSSSVAAWLSTGEVIELNDLPEASREGWLLRRWTAKESYLKGTGIGLAATPTTAELGPTVDGWPAWNTVLVDGQSAGWSVVALDLGAEHVGSLAVFGPPVPVMTAAWEPPW